jgi:ATP-dependent DNA helicase DinG
MISPVDAEPSSASLVAQVEAFFSPQGPLAKARNFEYRPQQQAMAVAVARALVGEENLIVEAGTGVGKSWPTSCPRSSLPRRGAKSGRLHPHHQPAGTARGKGSAHVDPGAAGGLPVHHAERPG